MDDLPSGSSALADAFPAFDVDPGAAVAALTGGGGTFCAGADPRAAGTPSGNRTEDDGDGPMGPTRLPLTKPLWCEPGAARFAAGAGRHGEGV